jgi:hypothetical protein
MEKERNILADMDATMIKDETLRQSCSKIAGIKADIDKLSSSCQQWMEKSVLGTH